MKTKLILCWAGLICLSIFNQPAAAETTKTEGTVKIFLAKTQPQPEYDKQIPKPANHDFGQSLSVSPSTKKTNLAPGRQLPKLGTQTSLAASFLGGLLILNLSILKKLAKRKYP